jgi:UDP-glucose:glycoprotein glucosyltransferase
LASAQPPSRNSVNKFLFGYFVSLTLLYSETVAIDQPTHFFPLVDILTSPDEFPSPLAKLSSEAIHQASLEIAWKQGYLADDSALRAFELALALHVSSPKLEAFYQYYEDRNLDRSPPPAGYLVEECASWVDWYGSRLCSSDDLRGVLSREGLEAGGNATM